MTAERLSHLYTAMKQAGLDLLVLNPSPTLTYLTGLHFHLMERPVVAFFKQGRIPSWLCLSLKWENHPGSFPGSILYIWRRPCPMGRSLFQSWRWSERKGFKAGLEPLWLRYLELQFVEAALPGATFTPASDVVVALRRQKEISELAICARQWKRPSRRLIRCSIPSKKV